MAYQSNVVLGKQYRHKSLGIEGYAEAITFYKNACERVLIAYTVKKQLHEIIADAVELIDVETGELVRDARQALPGGPERGMGTRPTATRR